MQIELGKFVPISGKSQAFLYKKAAFEVLSRVRIVNNVESPIDYGLSFTLYTVDNNYS